MFSQRGKLLEIFDGQQGKSCYWFLSHSWQSNKYSSELNIVRPCWCMVKQLINSVLVEPGYKLDSGRLSWVLSWNTTRQTIIKLVVSVSLSKECWDTVYYIASSGKFFYMYTPISVHVAAEVTGLIKSGHLLFCKIPIIANVLFLEGILTLCEMLAALQYCSISYFVVLMTTVGRN